MKKLIYILLLITLMPLVSCSDDPTTGENPNKDYPANIDEIQGSWQNYRNGSYTDITFDGDTYTLQVTNAISGNSGIRPIIVSEQGTYTMEGTVINLKPEEGTATFSKLEAYWSEGDKSRLMLYPIGQFTRP